MCECVTLILSVDGGSLCESAPESGIIAFNKHLNPPCIPFLEMDIDQGGAAK